MEFFYRAQMSGGHASDGSDICKKHYHNLFDQSQTTLSSTEFIENIINIYDFR